MTDQAAPLRILKFTSENFKRLSVVHISPDGNVIKITGANKQGKTSVLDAVESLFGGADVLPRNPIHTGKKKARNEAELGDDTGVKYIVERSFTGDNSYLTVKAKDGGKFGSPQKLMDSITGRISFDPEAFMSAKAPEQFWILRGLVKLEVDIDALDRRRAALFEERTGVNREVSSAENRAKAIVVPELPDEAPDLDALTQRLAEAGEHNANRERTRAGREQAQTTLAGKEAALERMLQDVERQKSDIAQLRANIQEFDSPPLPEPVDVAALTQEIAAARRISDGFRLRTAKVEATGQVTTLQRQAADLTTQIEGIDTVKQKAMAEAKFPVPGLGFTDGEVTFNGLPLEQASGAELLEISMAIGAALNPTLRVLLIRDGNRLDSKALAQMETFAKEHNLQIIMELVDESGEVGIVIEDGHVKGQEAMVAAFEKEEAERAAKGDVPAAEKPDAARIARAEAYRDRELAKLPGYTTLTQLDTADAMVKHMLASFPDLLEKDWKPAYAARVAELRK